MSAKTKAALARLFYEVESEFSDKSTEFVLEVTAERARQSRLLPNCDAGDVADAILDDEQMKG